MRFLSISLLLVAVIAAVPQSLFAQPPPQPAMEQQRTTQDNARHILFLHTGGAPGTESIVGKVLKELLRKGYSVRRPDSLHDEVGGPGVDYFYDEDNGTAADIAYIVNRELPAKFPRLEPRRQRVGNPRGYFGVWLF
jgi:hypothetical protein